MHLHINVQLLVLGVHSRAAALLSDSQHETPHSTGVCEQYAQTMLGYKEHTVCILAWCKHRGRILKADTKIISMSKDKEVDSHPLKVSPCNRQGRQGKSSSPGKYAVNHFGRTLTFVAVLMSVNISGPQRAMILVKIQWSHADEGYSSFLSICIFTLWSQYLVCGCCCHRVSDGQPVFWFSYGTSKWMWALKQLICKIADVAKIPRNKCGPFFCKHAVLSAISNLDVNLKLQKCFVDSNTSTTPPSA